MTRVPPATGSNRILPHLAWASATALFFYVGWVVVRPADPLGAVSVLSHARPVLMMVEVLVLAVFASALATVIGGRVRPDAGPFAVAIALIVVSWRGRGMTELLLDQAGTDGMLMRLVGESLFWVAVLFTAMTAAALTVLWCGHDGNPEPLNDTGSSSAELLGRMTAPNAPLLDRFFAGSRRPSRATDDLRTGLMHMAVVSAIALALIAILVHAAGDRRIRHGETCFAVAAGFYCAAHWAQARFAVGSAFWPFCAVGFTAVVAYVLHALLTGWSTDELMFAAAVPTTGLGRILPITFIAVGSAVVLSTHRWHRAPRDTDESQAD